MIFFSSNDLELQLQLPPKKYVAAYISDEDYNNNFIV